MIYCVWYPSGGFGHFINSILTLHGKKFKRPTGKLTLSATGDSHSLELTAPKYNAGTVNYNYEFDYDYNHSVLIDLGINSNSRDFISTFPSATVIKMCYTDTSWPIVANTMISKAMKTSIKSDVSAEIELWKADALWAQREKYFLFLRDHHLRTAWRPEPTIKSITVDSLTDYSKLKNILEQAGIELTDFTELWTAWHIANWQYFAPVICAQQVIDSIKNHDKLMLTNVTDVWTQAVIYYFIWLEFGQEVPHNDFENFFTSVDQIKEWLH